MAILHGAEKWVRLVAGRGGGFVMRAALIAIGAFVVLAGAGLIALLVHAESIESGQGEVRIELRQDAFPE